MKFILSFAINFCLIQILGANELTQKDFKVPEETLTKMTAIVTTKVPKEYRPPKAYNDQDKFNYFVYLLPSHSAQGLPCFVSISCSVTLSFVQPFR